MKKLVSFIASRRRRIVLFALDAIIACLGFAFSWILIKGERINTEFAVYVLCNVAVMSLTLLLFGCYSRIWRYAQLSDYFRVSAAVLFSAVLFHILSLLTGLPAAVQPIVSPAVDDAKLMHAFIVVSCLVNLAGLCAMRMVYYVFKNMRKSVTPEFSTRERKRTVIIGGGQACWLLLAEFQHANCEYGVVGIVDDDAEKTGRNIQGVPVFGPIEKVGDVVKKLDAEVIIIAIPSASKEARTRIVDLCNDTGLEVRIIPELHNIVDSRKLMSQMRKINTEDLLGRDVVDTNVAESASLIGGRVIMVTGGGGSIGSELCRQIMSYHPKMLVIVDISENNAYDIQQELFNEYGPAAPLTVHISSVRDYAKMNVLFERYRPAVVFHAAAHKHVPLMETDPEEALKNNVGGTYNVACLADRYGAERFVLISSDKAVNPTNVMGATKRFCEMLIQYFEGKSEGTEYCAVRFGNVLGSNGSVIPLFTKLIEQKRDLPVTHPEITRYFMTIPEAVSLVLRAGAMARGGEIFVLDMGKPVKIADLARKLIRLHGYVPDRDIKIKYTGLRPGEKLYEELLMGDDLEKTKHGKIFIQPRETLDEQALMAAYDKMCAAAESNDPSRAVEALAAAVPTFRRSDSRV